MSIIMRDLGDGLSFASDCGCVVEFHDPSSIIIYYCHYYQWRAGIYVLKILDNPYDGS